LWLSETKAAHAAFFLVDASIGESRMSWRYLFAVAAWLAGPACTLAADSVTVELRTTILPVCRFSASSGLDIAAARPFDTVDAPAASPGAAITYRCTNGVAPGFTITASCPGCPDGGTLIVSGDGVGRGMGSGRELMLVVALPPSSQPVQTAATGIARVTVSP
jgi:hypothetical protein